MDLVYVCGIQALGDRILSKLLKLIKYVFGSIQLVKIYYILKKKLVKIIPFNLQVDNLSSTLFSPPLPFLSKQA